MRSTLAVALLLCGTLAEAQHVNETVNVNVTNVDVVVTDAKGKPVTGLTKDDFEVYEGNKKREVTNVYEVTAAKPVAGTQNTVASSRAVLVLFDNTSLTLAMRRNAADALKTWLAQSLRPIDRVAIVTAIPSLQIKQPWTFDSRAAAAAIDVVAGETTSPAEQERREARRRVDEVVQRAASASQREIVRFDEATQAVRSYAAAAMRDERAVLAAMSASLTLFPTNAQKKVLILVGEGLQSNPGADMFQYLNSVKMNIESGNGPQSLADQARGASPLTEAGQYDVAPAMEQFSKSALRNGILVYAINPGQNEGDSSHMQDSGPNDRNAQFATSAGNRAGYEMLVRPTGGQAFYGEPAPMALATVASDLDDYYSLGYKTGLDSEQGQLVVKSKAAYRVRATRAAAPLSPDDRMREAVLAHHISAPMSNDMKIAVAADPPVADGTSRKVKLKVMIPVASLQLDRSGENVAGGFVVFVSSGDQHGKSTTVNRQQHDINWPAGTFEQLKNKVITFAVDVVVPPGLTQISVGVLDQKSQQTGFDRVSLGV